MRWRKSDKVYTDMCQVKRKRSSVRFTAVAEPTWTKTQVSIKEQYRIKKVESHQWDERSFWGEFSALTQNGKENDPSWSFRFTAYAQVPHLLFFCLTTQKQIK